jgi:glycine dehydrogenase subunit 1
MTHRYIPNTDQDRAEMLQAIGVSSVQDLFYDVPADLRYPKLKLPRALTEMELTQELRDLTARNANLDEHACFLGAGAYKHFVPATVPHLVFRSEFFTAYTPYQAEISQGTLQTIFEYQTLICRLTGMDAANASHYDGATAAAEAAILALNHLSDRKKIIVAPTLHPEYRATIRTYLAGHDDLRVVGDENLSATLDAVLDKHLDSDTACVIVANPDFLGQMRDLQTIADRVHAAGALFVVSAYPISLGLYQPPRAYGADVVIGEGQALGNAIAFGGPYLGIFATTEKLQRKMAGRLVGETTDTKGRRGFVLTLQAREQHIRREKASSNICTNQALCALAACVYLSTLGKEGLRRVAELCYHKAHYAAKKINALSGYRVDLKQEFFNEFVVECPAPAAAINARLRAQKIVGGYDLSRDYPHLQNAMLVAVTEVNTREQIDEFVSALVQVKTENAKGKTKK